MPASPSATTFDPEMILLRGGVVQCKQCFGDLVRLDGILRCGTCGLPESEQLQKDTTFRPPGPLEKANAENDRLKKENAEQRELIASLRMPADVTLLSLVAASGIAIDKAAEKQRRK